MAKNKKKLPKFNPNKHEAFLTAIKDGAKHYSVSFFMDKGVTDDEVFCSLVTGGHDGDRIFIVKFEDGGSIKDAEKLQFTPIFEETSEAFFLFMEARNLKFFMIPIEEYKEVEETSLWLYNAISAA